MPDKTWKPDPAASFSRRLGIGGEDKSSEHSGCPDMWELSNGDVAVIGKDLTESYRSMLPAGVSVRPDERLVILPRRIVLTAKADIPDA